MDPHWIGDCMKIACLLFSFLALSACVPDTKIEVPKLPEFPTYPEVPVDRPPLGDLPSLPKLSEMPEYHACESRVTKVRIYWSEESQIQIKLYDFGFYRIKSDCEDGQCESHDYGNYGFTTIEKTNTSKGAREVVVLQELGYLVLDPQEKFFKIQKIDASVGLVYDGYALLSKDEFETLCPNGKPIQPTPNKADRPSYY